MAACFIPSTVAKRFEEVVTDMNIEALAFGKPAPGKDYPTLFSYGWGSPVRMIGTDGRGASSGEPEE